MNRKAALLMAVVFTLPAAPRVAGAGGYDTPVLYSARHIGMGGTGISFVDDPTASFINPAGIGHIGTFAVTVNFSPILASINSVPAKKMPGSVEASALSPAFLVGVAGRPWKYLTLGLSIYPLASAGATYEYTDPLDENATFSDTTKIVFIEIAPTIAFNYEQWIRVGVAYRMTLAQLDRHRVSVPNADKDKCPVDKLRIADGYPADCAKPVFDLDASTFDFAGLRVGIQSTPIEGLDIGVVYRHKIEPTVKADKARVLITDFKDMTMDLVLPSRLGAGISYRMPIPNGGIRLAVDWEYAFQSQNDVSLIKGTKTAVFDQPVDPEEEQLESKFKWQDAMTVRAGVDVNFLEDWSARVGYIWDEQVGNLGYPSAFGTPPTDTHSATVGFGWRSGHFEANLAYAFRTGSVTITDEDTADSEVCLTCSQPGDYKLVLHGFYLDFTYRM